jgi:arylsulfatase A-like enzyme
MKKINKWIKFNVQALRLIFLLLVGMIPLVAQSQKNILFINIDDLRPQLGAYKDSVGLNGQSLMKTPNLDAIADNGTLFENAYCQVPICGASRLSIFAGARPYKEPGKNYGRFWTYSSKLKQASGKEPAGINNPGVTLLQYLKKHGYYTSSIGKVYHHENDDKENWDRFVKLKGASWKGIKAFEIGTEQKNNDLAYVDGQTTEDVIEQLDLIKDKKFFYCVGFARPHLPFNAPKKYWDMYPEGSIKLPENSKMSKNAPQKAYHKWHELRNYVGVQYADAKKTTLKEDYARQLIRGYFASVSYVDALIGKIVDKLKKTKDADGVALYDKTIIMIWGDHGFSLGEHNLWCKHSTFNVSTQTPLLVRDPDVAHSGQRSAALVELVDMYPTLLDLVGLKQPEPTIDNDGKPFVLQGLSFKPLLESPQQPWKEAVFSRYSGGDTIITKKYSYTEYVHPKDKLAGRMLYDRENDPSETINIAEDNPDLCEQLSKLLGGDAVGKRYAWKRFVDLGKKRPTYGNLPY